MSPPPPPPQQDTNIEIESIICDKVGGALAKYPHAKRVGNTIYLSGASSRQKDNSYRGVERSADGKKVILSIKEQTHGVIENIAKVLEEVGGTLQNLVEVTVFLANMSDYAAFNEVYNQYFDPATGPARTTIGVSSLPGEHLLIEIRAVAYIP